jgi:hypothetical protein
MNYAMNTQCFKVLLKKDVSTDQKWVQFFSKVSATNVLKIVKLVLSSPVINAAVKRLFSIKKNLWTDEQNRLPIKTVERVLYVRLNLKMK